MGHQGSVHPGQACTFHSSRFHLTSLTLLPVSCGVRVGHYRIRDLSDLCSPIFFLETFFTEPEIPALMIAREVSSFALALSL